MAIPQLIDTHCHLDFPEFDADRDDVIRRCREEGVRYLVNIGATLERSERSVELAGRYEEVYATVGIHPHDAAGVGEQEIARLKELARRPKVVGIGETGLDYYRNLSPMPQQKALFRRSIELAKELELPLVLHCRQAHEDLWMIIKEYLPLKAVVHCFSGEPDFLNECLDAGFLVSFTGNITYKKAEVVRLAVKETPLERLMLETDAPYLSPEGLRGRRNDPQQVRAVLQEVCRIKGLPEETVAEQTTANAKRFFSLT